MNDVWAMDFLSDKLFDGRPFRILTIMDCHTREALATSARTNFRACQVVEELDRIARQRGRQLSIRIDNVLRRGADRLRARRNPSRRVGSTRFAA
jgi:putative transposase